MTRLEKLLRKWGVSSAALKQQRICCDFGSAVTKVIVDGKILVQPTCLVLHQPTGSVLAIGEKAEQLLGALPKDAIAVSPIQHGKVVNTQALELYLRVLLQPVVRRDIASFLISPKISCASLHVGQSSQSAACNRVMQQWSRRISLHPVSTALWQVALQQRLFSGRGCIIDIGAMTTKFFILQDGQPVSMFMSDEGGETLTKDIQHIMRQHYQCDVGWQTAEQCKKSLLKFPTSTTAPKTQQLVHGKNILSSLPVAQVVDASDFLPVLASFLQRIITGFEHVCQLAPPECVADVQRAGIFLSGGGSQVAGLQPALEKKLQLKVKQSPSPQRDVVQGLWIL